MGDFVASVQRKSDTACALCITEHSKNQKPSIQQSETLCGKDHDGFRGVFVMPKVSRKSEVTLHAFVALES